jgi:hypothetical protein
LKFFDAAPTHQVSRAPRSALESDQHVIAAKRQTVDLNNAFDFFYARKIPD